MIILSQYNRCSTKAVKYGLFIVSTFLSIFTFGQYHPFNSYPAKGKTKSVEVFEIVGDSTNPIERKVETIIYDNKGRQILKQSFESFDRVYTEKSIYEDNQIVTYKCYCKDTKELEKNFIPQEMLEEKNESNYGWVSADDGSSRPIIVIHTLDKHGNRIETKNFDRNGSMNSLKKQTYSNENLLLRSELYYYRDEIDTEETYQYDTNGNCIEHVRNDLDRKKKERTLKKFDVQSRNIEHVHIINRDTISNARYCYVRNGNFEEYFSISKNGDSLRLKAFYYNNKNQLIRQLSFSSNEPYEEGTREYFSNGRLAKESFRNLSNNHVREWHYANDKNNNCVKTTQQFTSIEVKPDGNIQQTKQLTFIRKIVYH